MLERYCEKAKLADGIDILDLGCGWGSLSLFLAEVSGGLVSLVFLSFGPNHHRHPSEISQLKSHCVVEFKDSEGIY
jgi:cyclopropane fatty-acyl-phospholipid synthase-like methyltransferase